MGIKNYLIEGGSGTGKTTVATELERRGYHVIHGDRILAYVGDPETGRSLKGPPTGVDRIAWGYAHWIWPVEEVRRIASDRTHAATFFCGGSRNFQKFLHLFDRVFVLDVDVDTISHRLDRRPDEPGFEPAERALVLRYHRTKEFLPAGLIIQAANPVERVVDDILDRLD